MTVPDGWVVSELDGFREVRLYVTHQAMPSVDASFNNGVWLTYRVVSPADDAEAQLRNAMAERLRFLLPPEAELGPEQSLRIADRVALKRGFKLGSSDDVHSGYHYLISCQWGIVECQCRYVDRDAADQADEMISRMIIGHPRIPPSTAISTTVPAKPILGSWKSENARLVLEGDGKIQLLYDRARLRQLEFAQVTESPRVLRGDYQADADVLFLTWQDGSRLNLRWAENDGVLLLTDHQGRVSQLNRLLE